MGFAEKRADRVEREWTRLQRLCAANPGRLGPALVLARDERGTPSRLAVEMRVRTALRPDPDRPPRIARVVIAVVVQLPRRYPKVQPEVHLECPCSTPLFLGGARPMGPLGMVCPFRAYDRVRHTVVQHVLNVWSVLAGRTVPSERDSLSPAAARYWLDHPGARPFDRALRLPDDAPEAPEVAAARVDFTLEEVTP